MDSRLDQQPLRDSPKSPPAHAGWWRQARERFGKYNFLRWGIIILLMFGMIKAYLDRQAISLAPGKTPAVTQKSDSPAPPEKKSLIQILHEPIGEKFVLAPAVLGGVMSVFAWVYGVLQIPMGRLVDRYGFRRLYTISFILWSLAGAGCGMAREVWHLVVLQALLGAFEAIAAPASMAFIGRYFKEHERGLASGLYIAGTKAGPATAALLAGLMLQPLGWRWMMIIFGLGPIFWFLPWEYFNKRLNRAVAEGAGEIALPKKTLPPARQRLPLLVRLRPKQIVLYLRESLLFHLFLRFKTWGVFLGYLMYGYSLGLYLKWLPKYCKDQGFSDKDMGYFNAAAWGLVAVVAPLSGLIADRLIRKGRTPTQVRKGFIVVGFALGALVLTVPFIHHPTVSMGMLLIAVGGTGLIAANAWAITQSIAPAGASATLAAIQNLGSSTGSALAPMITGYLIQASGSYNPAFITAGVLMVAGVLAYVVLVGKVEKIKI